MLLKLIACNVFQREASLCLAQSPHVVDAEFTELGEHARSAELRKLIQQKIDAVEASGKAYDAVLVLFGVCGNATIGLEARGRKVVIPRAHDCCTILLGSRQRFAEHFQDAPSTPFSSNGYMDRGSYFLRVEDGEAKVVVGDEFQALVERYGEEDARFVWDQMHPATPETARVVFIDVPEMSHLGHKAKFEEKALVAGKQVEHLPGDLRLIRKLLNGQWDEEFLVLEPGRKTAGVYDWEEILRAK